MLDSGTGPENESDFDEKRQMFCAVNSLLAITTLAEPGTWRETLIHREELDFEAEEKPFFNQLYTRAKECGWTKTKKQLDLRLRQNVEAQKHYQMEKYALRPLAEPDAVACYFFRNKSGVMLGELAHYFSRDDEEGALDAKYWEGFERNITNFHIMDVDLPQSHDPAQRPAIPRQDRGLL